VHSIGTLTSYASGLTIPMDVPNCIFDNSVMISDWVASGRYDIHFSFRINTLEKN